jgi:hypothetical protein
MSIQKSRIYSPTNPLSIKKHLRATDIKKRQITGYFQPVFCTIYSSDEQGVFIMTLHSSAKLIMPFNANQHGSPDY